MKLLIWSSQACHIIQHFCLIKLSFFQNEAAINCALKKANSEFQKLQSEFPMVSSKLDLKALKIKQSVEDTFTKSSLCSNQHQEFKNRLMTTFEELLDEVGKHNFNILITIV